MDQQHVWMVRRRGGDGPDLPIRDWEVAKTFWKVGWQVAGRPYSAFSDEELRCLGISRARRSQQSPHRGTNAPACGGSPSGES